MTCDRCEAENLTDRAVCPSCARQVHFTNRPCSCANCAVQWDETEIFEFLLAMGAIRAVEAMVAQSGGWSL